MRKTFLLLALVVPMLTIAQIVEVTSIKKIKTPIEGVRMAGISPDGSYILVTNHVQAGLTKVDLATQESSLLTTAESAGYDVKISEDGKQILFREMSMSSDKSVYSSLKRMNLTTREVNTIVTPTRELGGYAIKRNVVMAVNKRQMRKQAITSNVQTTSVDVPLVSTDEDNQLRITRNGVTSILSPNGTDELYVWASVSPDATKVCYFLLSGGCWVANIDGSNPRKISEHLHDAKWYNNNVLIGMEDKDNGEQFTYSTIVLQGLDGRRQVLTDGVEIAMYPYASLDGKRIAFSTDEGNAYVINVK